MKTLIKNGKIVIPDGIIEGDILIDGEKIAEIAKTIDVEAETIDAKGRYIIPGGVDVHTHLNLKLGDRQVSDGFYYGTRAAAFGGTTTIVDHPEAGKEGCSLFAQPMFYRKNLEQEAVIDYGIHGVFQHVDEYVLAEIPEVVQSGIPSMKIYMTYANKLEADEVALVLKIMSEAGGLAAFHAEDDTMVNELRAKFASEGKLDTIYHAKSRPDEAEAESVEQILNIAESSGNVPVYIVHLSSAKGLDVIRDAKRRGAKVIAETCPQYLYLDESEYEREGDDRLKCVMAPPIRHKEDRDALWDGIKSGDIEVIGTDHCSFSLEDKKRFGSDDFRVCPGGIPGVETRLPLMYGGMLERGMSVEDFVSVVSEKPAKTMGMFPQKGCLAVGSDADIVIWDGDVEYELSVSSLHQKCDYTPYEGMKVRGRADVVMVRGNIIVNGEEFSGEKGMGQFIHRNLNS